MKILITAGPVHAPLDDNKIISNRARGKWAEAFAFDMAKQGHEVTLLISELCKRYLPEGTQNVPKIIEHNGYKDYREHCLRLAPEMDGAVMAAAVTNYIPEYPIPGKMLTTEERISIPFIKTPNVINEMRKLNPRLNLIGAKLTIGEPEAVTVTAAQKVLEASKAHVIVANDKSNLKRKLLCFPDGAVIPIDFESATNGSKLFTEILHDTLTDTHFRTECPAYSTGHCLNKDARIMEDLLSRYRHSFLGEFAGQPKSFGAIAVKTGEYVMLCTVFKNLLKPIN